MNLAHPGLRDPRLYQILVLASLLIYGVTRLDLEILPGRALLLLAVSPAHPVRLHPGSGGSRPSIRGAP